MNEQFSRRLHLQSARDDRESSLGRWKAEWIFASLLAFFGLVFAFALPPCQTPDENVHFIRAYSLSQGHLTPRLMCQDYGGDLVPESVCQTIMTFSRLWARPDQKATLADFRTVISASDSDKTLLPASFGGAVMNTIVPYLPSATGVYLARTARLNPLSLFYAGRVANLMLGVVLVFLALRITPVYKCAFGAIALIPISVQQYASYSPDASVNGLSLLLVAVLLRLALGSGPPVRGRVVAGILALTAWLTLSKFPYAAVISLFAAVPAMRFGSRLRYLLMGLGLALLALGLVAYTTQASRGLAPESHQVAGYRTSVPEQIHFIKHHKIQYIETCIHTCIKEMPLWLEHLTILGTLDTVMDPLSSRFFIIFLVAVAIIDQPSGIRLSFRTKLAAAAAGILAFGLMLTSQYGWHSPVGAPIVMGIQGRYLMPILPMVVILLNSRFYAVQVDARWLRAVTAAGCVGMLIVSVGRILHRYYLPDPAQALSPMNTIGLASLGFLIVAVALGPRSFGSKTSPSAGLPEDAPTSVGFGPEARRRLPGQVSR